IDRAILWQLQGDGRLANTELADRVGLSPSPCLRRVRALEETGIITGYRAVVDPVAVNRGFQVLVHVTMTVGNRASDMAEFEARVAELDEVTECRRMFGDPDYLLWVAVADLATYEKLYMDKLVSLPGVARTSSQLTMRTIKAGGRIPV
ncbi:MAG TPA: Lrp/AsnC family transcriptional regulator, partial [Actinomycetes bacterium]|nr:Lrp/AsnC family transcriptional regulator [Actinomycetes bacterium]